MNEKGFSYVLTVILLIIGSSALIALMTTNINTEYKIIEGNIIDVQPVLEDDGSIKYYNVTFDNNESYFIRTHENIDWTVNSKLIVELYQSYRDGKPNYDSWYLESITKVPENPGELE